MEISLDNMQVSFMTAGIKTASDSVSLTAAETEIKSRSEAMDKFQEEYRQLKAFVKDYRDTLNNDLAKIDLIINAINENDRKEYNKLKKKKADNKKQQEQCQSEIDVLDEKIERLKAAYRKLDDAKEAIDDIKHNQRNMINSDLYQCMWTGSNAQECYDSCESGNLYTAYDGYVSNIDAAEDAINWEINTLKEKVNEKYGVLSGLVNAWDDLCTKIQNFFN